MPKPLDLYLQKLSQQPPLQEAFRTAQRTTYTPSRLATDHRTLNPTAPVLTFEAVAQAYLDGGKQHLTGIMVGVPGSGISTSLAALTYAAAQRATTDPNAPMPVHTTLSEKYATLDAVIEQAFWEIGLTLQGPQLQQLLQSSSRPLWLLVDVANEWDAQLAATALDALFAALDAAYPAARWMIGVREDVAWHLPLHWQRYTYYRLNLAPQEDAVEQFLDRLDPVIQMGMRQLFVQVPAMRDLIRRPAVAERLAEISRSLPDGTPRTILVHFLRAMMTAAHAKSLPGSGIEAAQETLTALMNAGTHGLRRSSKNAQLLPVLRQAGIVEQFPGDKAMYRLSDDSWINVIAALEVTPSPSSLPLTPYPAPSWQAALATKSNADLETLNDLERQLTLAQAEVYFRRAITMRDEGRGREAMAQIRAALAIAADRADFQVAQGTIAIANEQYDEGRGILEEALPYAPTGEGYDYLAQAYQAMGWYSEACQSFARAADFDWTGQAEAAANAAALTDDPARQQALWERAISLDDQRADWHFALGQLHAKQGNLPTAQKRYDAALKLNRTHGEANHAMGMLLLQQGNSAAARQHLLVATAQQPNRTDPAALQIHSNWLVDLGELFETTGDGKAAEESYSQAITHAPRNPRAYARKGMLLRRNRRFEDAEYLLNESRLLDDAQSDVHFEMGLLHEAQGKFAEATKSYRRAAQLDPNTAIIRTHLGKVYRELGNDYEAQDALERALDLDPRHSPTLTELGILAERKGEFARAAQLYANAVDAMPQNVQAIFRQGVMCLQLEQAYDALPLLTAAAKAMPDSAEVHWYHGEALRRTDGGEAALTPYRKAIRLAPENMTYRHAFARHAITLKRWEDARLALDTILEREPGNVEALLQLADLNVHKGAFAAALEVYSQALELQPQEATLYLQMAGIYAKIGQLDDGIRILQQAVTLIGETPDLLSQIAALYEEQGMMESACEQLNFALESDPAHEPSRLQRARLHTKIGHRKEAYYDWQTLLQYNPACYEAHFGTGWLQEADHLDAEALHSYEQALQADIPAEAWLVAHGRVAAKVGQKDIAQQSLKRVLQRESIIGKPLLQAEAHYLLATLTEATTALVHLEQAIALDKHNAAYFLAKAQVQDSLGKRQAAFSELEKARTFAGADGEILAQIARQYDEWGYNHEAIQSYIRAVEFVPDSPPLWVRLAVLQRGMEKTTEAREALEEAIRHRPDFAPAYRELGRTYEQIGDDDNAKANLVKALHLDPDDVVAVERLAVLHLNAKRYNESEKLLKHALLLDSANPAYYTLLGTLYVQSDRPAHALDIWQRAAEREPQNALYHRERGRAHLQMGQTDDAKQAFVLAERLDKNDPELHFLKGQTFEALGNLSLAAKAYASAIENDGQELRYQRALAELCIRQGKWDEALYILRDAQAVNNSDPEVDYLMALCLEQMSGGSRLDQAIERAKHAVLRANTEPRYLRKLGDLHAKQGQWAEAQSAYHKLTSLQPQDRSLALALGESALHLKQYEGAMKAFRHAVLLDGFDPEANRLLAQSIALHFRPVLLAQLAQAELPLTDDFNALVAEGLDAAQRAYDYSGGDHASTDVLAHLYLLKQEPETAFALLQRTDPALFGRALFGELDGIVLLAVGESARAVEAFQHAARVHKESPLLWLAYSVASNEMGDLEEALHFAKDAAALAPDEGIYTYALAHLTMLANDPRRARKLLAQAISLRGNIPAWHRHLGQLAAAALQYDAAHTAFTTALAMVEKHTPEDRGEEGLILRARAQVFQQENNLNGAIAELRRAIECFPNDPIWYQELAVLLQNVGDYGDAEQQYRSARKLQPDNADIALALAHTLEISNKPADALVELEAATAKWSNHVPAWCQLGRVRLTLKQNDAAHQAFQTALRLDPVEPLALLGMAQYHNSRDQREDERSYILKAYEVAPENADVLTQVGRLYMESGNDAETRAEAANFFHAALQKDVSHLYAHVYLASLYNGEGQTPLALHHYQIAADLSPMSGWVWSALAECYAQQPNYKAAVDCYERAIYCDPENGEHYFNLGSLHYKNHRFEECLPAYRKADKLKFRRDKCNIYMMQARAKLAMGAK
jgi:tetratricopeptide (TPR) repeat protein